MSWISDIINGISGGTIEGIGNTIKQFVTTDADRMKLQQEMEKIILEGNTQLEETLRTELGAKERILVAELQQGDNYTKRARPTVVYVGIGAIIYNYCIAPSVGFFTSSSIIDLPLPTEFWLAWGGIVSTWSIGRSFERTSNKVNKVSSLITGSKLLN